MTNVIVQGVFSVNQDEREQFLEASIEGMRVSRQEAGCLEYVLAADPVDPGRVILSERWESIDHLDEHIRAMTARRESDGPAANPRPDPLSRQITVYEVASSRPLG